MREWNKRPKEIASNFNPAFCGELVYYALEEYQKCGNNSLPMVLLPLILPIVLHKETRDAIGSSRTQMSVWLHQNPEVRINFASRVSNLLEVTLETYVFLLYYKVIEVENGEIVLKNKLIKRKNTELHEETKACIDKAKIIGRWFAKHNDIATIYFMWGVKP